MIEKFTSALLIQRFFERSYSRYLAKATAIPIKRNQTEKNSEIFLRIRVVTRSCTNPQKINVKMVASGKGKIFFRGLKIFMPR